MKKPLILLILVLIVVCWKFVFTSSKVEFTDPMKVLQGAAMAFTYKTSVKDYWQEHDALPTADDWDKKIEKPVVDISKSLVKSIQIGEEGPGVISIYFTNKPGFNIQTDISGKRLLLIPLVNDRKLEWKCKGTVPADLMPKKCVMEK